MADVAYVGFAGHVIASVLKGTQGGLEGINAGGYVSAKCAIIAQRAAASDRNAGLALRIFYGANYLNFDHLTFVRRLGGWSELKGLQDFFPASVDNAHS